MKVLGTDTGISKSEVSRICKDPDGDVGAFRDRSLAQMSYPYVFLDATDCKARVNHRVVSQAIVVAIGVTADGRREVLGMDVGDSEDGAFWAAFLRGLKARGLGGGQVVVSDARAGLKQAIAAVFIGSAWQRCRVHFMRNDLAVVPRGNAEMVVAAIRTNFAQPDAEHVEEQFDVIAGMLGRQLPNRSSNSSRPIRRRLGHGTDCPFFSRVSSFRGGAPPESGRRWNAPTPTPKTRARSPKCGSQRHSMGGQNRLAFRAVVLANG